MRTQVLEHLAQERRRRVERPRRVEQAIHAGRVLAEEPEPHPVGGPIADEAKVRRAGQDEPDPVGLPRVAQPGAREATRGASVALDGDAP
jgi:hypothetical protein